MFLVIGASGYFGSYFLKNILENSDQKIIATYNNSQNLIYQDNPRVKWINFDIANPNKFDEFINNNLPASFFDIHNKDSNQSYHTSLSKKNEGYNSSQDSKYKVIFLSSFHHPEEVEKNREKAFYINVHCLDEFLLKAKNKIESLYYSSSDSVYGESFNNKIFVESDILNPANTYGRTKALAEQVVLMHGFSVIRYSLLMGQSLIEKKHFYDKITQTIKKKEFIEMYSDSYRSVISFDKASHYTIQLILKHYHAKDIINIAGDDNLSKYEIALGIAKKNNLDTDYIKSTLISNNQNFGTNRAKNTLISNSKLKKILNLKNISYEF